MSGFCKEGRIDEAMALLEEMKKQSAKLTLLTSEGLYLNKTSIQDCIEFLVPEAGMQDDAVVALYGLAKMGFKPEQDSCARLVLNVVCRERKLLLAFELLDELTANECEDFCTLCEFDEIITNLFFDICKKYTKQICSLTKIEASMVTNWKHPLLFKFPQNLSTLVLTIKRLPLPPQVSLFP
ncbi:hypothetical protein NC652_004902 [Populus alba x Populus x berolinensis]|nr:hypothetical protein NC652_004902 [Populus alba x Populus x berolinensis]